MDTVLDYLNHWAGLNPGKCFSAFLDRHGNPRENYTYQSFEARTRFLAEYILDETGLQRGDRVALVYPPGLEMVASFVACGNPSIAWATPHTERSPAIVFDMAMIACS